MKGNLEGGPLEGVEDEKLLEEVLTVGGHIKGDAVLAPQHPFTQLLWRAW